MATQALIFAETISGMKKAIKRKAYSSDSDSEIEKATNRAGKLRRKARFVHEGQLAPPTGPQVYKRTIEHAGFRRDIISRNPPLVDDDGYEVDSEDDDERAEAAIASAAEFDPYSEIKIEYLLAPLTAASDLAEHPTLSKPFTSNTLAELTRHAGEMVQKEKASLWRIKHLLTRLSGDNTWIPCEEVETDNDYALFLDEPDRDLETLDSKAILGDDGDQVSTGTMVSEDAELPVGLLAVRRPSTEINSSSSKQSIAAPGPDEDVNMTSTEDISGNSANGVPNESASIPNSERQEDIAVKTGLEIPNGEKPRDDTMDLDDPSKPPFRNVTDSQIQGTEEVEGMDVEAGEEDLPVPRRMRTRAQAQAASDDSAPSGTSMSPNSSSDLFIHPYFLAPLSSRPDRDLGLPQLEAEETRKLLQLYIQKQEEVCRGAQKVYDGLLKADRYRKLVLKWSKAEGHVGPNRDMSDGEDWYDKEEWGLDADLKKGQDEEEEDAATTAKKTRTRRQ